MSVFYIMNISPLVKAIVFDISEMTFDILFFGSALHNNYFNK